MKTYGFWFWFPILLAGGCALPGIRVDVVSERTTLENQVLGSYNSLADEVLLVASVRGVDPLGRIQTPPRVSREKQDAIEAMQVVAFHEDDIESFKELGWVGEDNQGFLAPFPMSRERVPGDLGDFSDRYTEEEFKSVLDQVNEARDRIMRRVLEVNPALTADDLPGVRGIFAKINRDNAASGQRIQNEDGSWVLKP